MRKWVLGVSSSLLSRVCPLLGECRPILMSIVKQSLSSSPSLEFRQLSRRRQLNITKKPPRKGSRRRSLLSTSSSSAAALISTFLSPFSLLFYFPFLFPPSLPPTLLSLLFSLPFSLSLPFCFSRSSLPNPPPLNYMWIEKKRHFVVI